MTVAFRPLSDRVAVRRLKRDEQTPGGIIIPETAADERKAWEGVVVAVGPGKVSDGGHSHEPRVKTTDRVLVGKYAGQEIELAGDKIVILREDDILGVLGE